MNRRDFLAQSIKVLALSPRLANTKVAKIVVGPTIADKIRLEKPPPLDTPSPDSPPWFVPPRNYSLQLSGHDYEDAFLVNFDVRDSILYLWQ